jgi:hypothetical protein
MGKLRSGLRYIGGEAIREAISHVAWNWVLPAVAGVAAMLAGLHEDIQIMWVIFGAAGTAAFMSIVLAQLDIHRQRRNLEGALALQDISMPTVINKQDRRNVYCTYHLVNTSSHVLYVQFDRMEFYIDDHSRQDARSSTIIMPIPSKLTQGVNLPTIKDLNKKPHYDGRLKLEVKYGTSKDSLNWRYILDLKIDMLMIGEGSGQIDSRIITRQDVAEWRRI